MTTTTAFFFRRAMMMMMMMTSLLFVLSSSSSTANDDDDVNDARMMTTTTRESGLRDARAFRTIIAKASNNKTFLSSSNHHYRNEAGVDDDEMVVFEGLSDVSTLQWTSNYIRRLLPKHATLENETWEGAAEFTKHLSWELIDDYSNGMMLLGLSSCRESAEHRSVAETVPLRTGEKRSARKARGMRLRKQGKWQVHGSRKV